MNNYYSVPTNQANDADALASSFNKLLHSNHFINIVRVTDVRGEAPDLIVDAVPLVANIRSKDNSIIDSSVIHNIPVWRLQRGNSAIIMNPVPGDIGLIAVCDDDISVARETKKESVPGSKRKHSRSDAIYLGGLLNQQPNQFIEFSDNSINITSPGNISVICSTANITASNGVTVDTNLAHFTGNITANGDITDNAGSQSSSLKSLRDSYNEHKHAVSGVQIGGSTVVSASTDSPA
ncbi:phage baseplate protein [Enterobacteriaceae bacterium LUAb1]